MLPVPDHIGLHKLDGSLSECQSQHMESPLLIRPLGIKTESILPIRGGPCSHSLCYLFQV